MMINQADKNIAIFTHGLVDGGVERTVSNMASYFPDSYNINIFLFDSEIINYSYAGTLVGLNLPLPPYDSLFNELFITLKCIYKVRKLKKKLGISVCLSLKEGPNFINVLSGTSKVVVSVREHKSTGLRFKGAMRILVKGFIRTFYNRADLVVTVSKGIAHDLVRKFGVKEEKIRTIYNASHIADIGKKALEDIKHEHEGIFENPVVINVGRLSREKSQWHLIRAFSMVKEHCKDARLVILGEGEEEGYLRKLATELDLESEVYFLGFQKNPFKYLAKAKVFVLSSSWEGFPNVLVEAMACRMPVISTDCKSGPREILSPDTDIHYQSRDIEYARYGILVPALDGAYKKANEPLTKEERTLANAIIKLLTDVDLREKYSRLGYERASDFGMEKFIEGWSNVIKEVVTP